MAEQQKQRDGEGFLFPETRRAGERSPHMTGRVEIGGETYQLAAWQRTSRGGKDYMKIAVRPYKPGAGKAPAPAAEAAPSAESAPTDNGGDGGEEDLDLPPGV